MDVEHGQELNYGQDDYSEFELVRVLLISNESWFASDPLGCDSRHPRRLVRQGETARLSRSLERSSDVRSCARWQQCQLLPAHLTVVA